MKTFLLASVALWLAVATCVAPAQAEAIPDITASRVIELAPRDATPRVAPPVSADKMPVVSSVALDPTGKLLAAVGDDHLVRIFDASNGKLLHRWASHVDWVRASVFRPDGTMLATSGADRRIQLWDTVGQGKPRGLHGSLQVIYTLVYSPDGRTLAAAGFADRVWVFDADQGRLLRELPAPGSDIRALCFSPDGLRMAAAGRAGVVRVWSSINGQVLFDAQASSRRICALAWSPDGATLAAAGQQRVVRLLEATTGKPLADLPERSGEVLALAFCGPDTLVSGGSGNVVHVWNLPARQERCRLVGHTGSVTTLAFDRSSGTIISGSYDTTVRLWDIKSLNQDKITQRVGPQRAD